MSRLLLLTFLLIFYSIPVYAVRPDEMLADPTLETRAREISESLRCLVCQNQSIDDSDADLAHDLRMLVRARLQAGDSNGQVKQYIAKRYGDYVLLQPPFKRKTYALWFGPLAFFVAAAIGMLTFYFRERNVRVRPLSDAERQKLETLLKTHSDAQEKK